MCKLKTTNQERYIMLTQDNVTAYKYERMRCGVCTDVQIEQSSYEVH